MMGNSRQELASAGPGQIVAIVGLKQPTPATPSATKTPRSLSKHHLPQAGDSQAIIPAASTDSGKLGEAINRLTRDDPTLKFHTDEETKDLSSRGWASFTSKSRWKSCTGSRRER